jgi:hypothetical protein
MKAMIENEYGTLIEDTLRDATEPMTAAELREAVGCSRQRIYTWLQANEHRLVKRGKDGHGGYRFELRTSSTATGGAGIGVGSTLVVANVALIGGRVVLTALAEDGTQFNVEPA